MLDNANLEREIVLVDVQSREKPIDRRSFFIYNRKSVRIKRHASLFSTFTLLFSFVSIFVVLMIHRGESSDDLSLRWKISTYISVVHFGFTVKW